MEKGFSQRDCGCTENCNEIQYAVSDISLQPVDGTYECMRRPSDYRNSRAYFYANDLFPEDEVKLYKENDVALLLAEKMRCRFVSFLFFSKIHK